MLAEIYIEALLVDEELADLVWEALTSSIFSIGGISYFWGYNTPKNTPRQK